MRTRIIRLRHFCLWVLRCSWKSRYQVACGVCNDCVGRGRLTGCAIDPNVLPAFTIRWKLPPACCSACTVLPWRTSVDMSSPAEKRLLPALWRPPGTCRSKTCCRPRSVILISPGATKHSAVLSSQALPQPIGTSRLTSPATFSMPVFRRLSPRGDFAKKRRRRRRGWPTTLLRAKMVLFMAPIIPESRRWRSWLP